jgi:TRAP-type C4-dicarboxylate transport system permease small subunit
MLPLAGRRGAEIIHCLIGIAFGAVIVRYSFLAAYEAWEFGDLSIGSLRAPLWMFYAALPAGFVLVTLRYIHRLWLLAFRFTPELLDHAKSEG